VRLELGIECGRTRNATGFGELEEEQTTIPELREEEAQQQATAQKTGNERLVSTE
jgi:hypothetical protein